MGKNIVRLNTFLHPYVELFDKVFEESQNNNPLFKAENQTRDELPIIHITGPGFTLIRCDEPHHRSYTYSNGIDYFFVNRVLNASAIVRIGSEEIRFEDILASPKALVFLKDISNTLTVILSPKSDEPKQLKK